jgi:adenylate cyclase
MDQQLSLDAIRPCLEGAIPGVMATCSADGIPNVAYLSQVEYVDAGHLALSFQFFNKTRQNVLDNPEVELLVVHPFTGEIVRIQARYLRTETEGPLFERMKAKLAGIASHTGMSEVFVLLGADIYQVTGLEQAVAPQAHHPAPAANKLPLLRRCIERVGACTDLDGLLDTTLDALEKDFGVSHAMLLMLDAAGQRLYTVASRGYGSSGIGSEISLGEGVIGVAARMRTPIRINHLTLDTAYSRTIREQWQEGAPEREIPLPGLAQAHSQMALPITSGEGLMGVLFVESPQEMRFSWDDEDAMATIAAHVGLLVRQIQLTAEVVEVPEETAPAPESVQAAPQLETVETAPLRVRYFESDGSVFLGDDYLIKGVAGAVLWKLLRDHAQDGRTEFSNRELRLSPEIRLPDVSDNLEARLVLLGRRLVDRQTCVRMEKTGRGRFRLVVARPLVLASVPA